MPKKRRTKQQKIIAKLKRQIQETQRREKSQTSFSQKTTTKKGQTKTSQLENINKIVNIKKTAYEISETKSSLFSYDPILIKKSLTKTLVLSLVFFALIFSLYYFIEIQKALPL
ncbi:hypothetical protein ACFLZ1_02805 [Patescibacteria group bacterium]